MESKKEYYRSYHQEKQQSDPNYRKNKNDKAKEYYHTKNKNTIVLLNIDSGVLQDWQIELEQIALKARMKWHNETVPAMRREFYEKQRKNLVK